MTIFRFTLNHGGQRYNGDKGEDTFDVPIPAGEGFLRAQLAAVPGPAGTAITSVPEFAATGAQRVKVKWWYDGTLIGGPGGVRVTLDVITGIAGRIVLFEHRDYEGVLVNLSLPTARLAAMDNNLSSMAVLRGNWSFYRNPDFTDPFMKNGSPIVLPPGLYPLVDDFGIQNDAVSSLQAVNAPPNM